MSYCRNEDEHKREGREDYERGGHPVRYYDQWDDCGRAYQEGFDEARRAEERREEYREEERLQEERAAQRARESHLDEQYEMQYPEQQWPEPTLEELCGGYTGHAYEGDDELGPRCHCGLYRNYRWSRLI